MGDYNTLSQKLGWYRGTNQRITPTLIGFGDLDRPGDNVTTESAPGCVGGPAGQLPSPQSGVKAMKGAINVMHP